MASLTNSSSTTISNNTATSGGAGYVAAGGNVTDTNTTYTSNSATAGDGGAVYINAATTSPSAPAGVYSASSTTFQTNQAPAGNGGAIYDAAAPPYTYPPSSNYSNLTSAPSNTFTGNTAVVAFDGAVTLPGNTPNISEPATISTPSSVLNNYDINYSASSVSTSTKTLVSATGMVLPPGSTVPPGGTVYYQITIPNTGQLDTGTPVTIDESLLPSPLTYSGTPPATYVMTGGASGTGNLTSSGTPPIFTLPVSIPGISGSTVSSAIITIPVQVPTGGVTNGQVIGANNVTITPGPSGASSGPVANIGATAGPTIAYPVLSLAKSNDHPSQNVSPGDTFNYTITVTNNGSAPTANPYTVTDTLPAGVTYVGPPTDTTITGAATGQNVTFNVKNALAGNGASQTITFPVKVAANAALGPLPSNYQVAADPGDSGPVLSAPTGPGINPELDPTPPVVVPQPITAEKEASVTTVPPGGLPGNTFNYTITITNPPATAGGMPTNNPVNITDALPTGVTYSGTGATYSYSVAGGTSSSGTVNGTSPNFSIPASLPAGSTTTVTIPVTVDAGTPLQALTPNTATIDPGNGPVATATETTPPVVSAPVISLTKVNSQPGATIYPGDTFNYVVTITNTGNTPTKTYTVSDQLPQYVTYTGGATSSLNSSINPTVGAGNVVQFAINNSTGLQPGQSETLTIPVTVSANAPVGQLNQNSTIIDPANNLGNSTTYDAGAKDDNPPKIIASAPTVTKKASVTQVVPGGTYNYTITVDNTQAGAVATANPMQVTETLPANVTYAGGATSSFGTVTPAAASTNSPMILSVAGSIPAGQIGTITIPVVVSNTAPQGVLTPANIAAVDPGNGITPQPSGVDPAPPTVVVPSVTVEKVNSQPGQNVTPGQTFNYQVKITNTGQAATTNPYTISELFPDNVTYNGAASSNINSTVTPSAASTSSSVVFSVANSLAPGASETITIPVIVSASAPDGALGTNQVTVTPGGGGSATTGTDSNPPVVYRVAPTVTKKADTTTVQSGGTYNYTITIDNTAPGTLTSVNPLTVIENLPTNVTYVGNATSSFGSVTPTAASANNPITLQVAGSVPAGSIETITIPVKVANNTPEGALSPANTATVNPGNLIPPQTATDPNPPTVVTPKLAVTKSNDVTSGIVHPGDTFNYVINIQNNGTADTANPVILNEAFPQYITYAGNAIPTGTTPTSATTNSNVSFSVPGPIPANGGSLTVTIPVKVATNAPIGYIGKNSVVAVPGAGGNATLPAYDPNPPQVTAVSPTVTKTADQTQVYPGSTFNYTITVDNSQPGTMDTVVPMLIADTLPPNVTISGPVTSSFGAVSISGNYNFSVAGSVAAGKVGTITIPVTVNAGTPAGPLKPNTAVVTPGLGNTPPPAQDIPPVVMKPTVTVTKSNDASGDLVPGQVFNYYVQVTNTGNAPTASPLLVTDQFPPKFITYNGGATSSIGSVTPTAPSSSPTVEFLVNGSIPPGGTATITIPSIVAPNTPAGSYNPNTVVIDPGNGGDKETGADGSLPAVISVPPVLNKQPSETNVLPGQTFYYTITIDNTIKGAMNIPAGFTLAETIPSSLTIGQPTSPSGNISVSGSGRNFTLTSDFPIPAGSVATITIPVTVAPGASVGQLANNTAILDPHNGAGTVTVQDPVPPTVVKPVLVVTKTNDTVNNMVTVGGTFNYIINVTNNGTTATNNPFVVKDVLPNNLTLNGTITSSYGVGTVTNSGDNKNLVLSISGSIPPGNSATITIPVQVSSSAVAGTLNPNTTFVDPGDGDVVQATDTPPQVVVPSLEVTKAADKAYVKPGDTFNYVINIANNGLAPTANPFEVQDLLPPNVTLNGSPSSPIGTITNNGRSTSLDLLVYGTLQPNSSTTITIPVIVSSTAPLGSLSTNTATVLAGMGSNPVSATDTTPPVVAVADLSSSTKTSTPKSPEPGDSITYTIQVTNSSDSYVSTNNPFTVTDTLPQGLIYNTNSFKAELANGSLVPGATMTPNPTAPNYIFTIPKTLAPGQTINLVYTALVDPTNDINIPGEANSCNPDSTGACTGGFKNTAIIIADPTNPDGPGTIEVQDLAPPTIPIPMVVDPSKVITSPLNSDGTVQLPNTDGTNSVEYTIHAPVTNAMAEYIKIIDNLPSGMEYQTGSASATLSDSATGSITNSGISLIGPDVAGNMLTFTIPGPILSGQTLNLTFKANLVNFPVSPAAGSTVDNVATVQPYPSGPVSPPFTAPTAFPAPSLIDPNNPAAMPTKCVDTNNTKPMPGGYITYDISATNYGSMAAPTLVLTDALPTGLTFDGNSFTATVDGADVTQDVTPSGSATKPVFTFYDPLEVGSTAVVNLKVNIDQNVEIGSCICNVATWTTYSTDPGTNTNSCETPNDIPCSNGDCSSCNSSSNSMVIPPCTSCTTTVTSGSQASSCPSCSSNNDNGGGSVCQSSCSPCVMIIPNLTNSSITKTSSKDTVEPGDVIDYSVTVNPQSDLSGNLSFNDLLPNYTSLLGSTLSYSSGSQNLTLQNIGSNTNIQASLPGPFTTGQPFTITYSVVVDCNAPQGATLTNYASVGDDFNQLTASTNTTVDYNDNVEGIYTTPQTVPCGGVVSFSASSINGPNIQQIISQDLTGIHYDQAIFALAPNSTYNVMFGVEVLCPVLTTSANLIWQLDGTNLSASILSIPTCGANMVSNEVASSFTFTTGCQTQFLRLINNSQCSLDLAGVAISISRQSINFVGDLANQCIRPKGNIPATPVCQNAGGETDCTNSCSCGATSSTVFNLTCGQTYRIRYNLTVNPTETSGLAQVGFVYGQNPRNMKILKDSKGSACYTSCCPSDCTCVLQISNDFTFTATQATKTIDFRNLAATPLNILCGTISVSECVATV